MPSSSIRGLITIALTAVLLTACGVFRSRQPTAVPADTFTPPPATATRRFTATPRPTRTPLPTPTFTPRPTGTATHTPTVTTDPMVSGAKYLAFSWQPNYELMISIQFPGPVDPSRYRVMLEDSRYDCQVLTQYPDRLYCVGRARNIKGVATLRIYQAGSDTPGYEKGITIPWFNQTP